MAASVNSSTRVSPGVRPDIQALRALAVVAVILYHLWPLNFTGGYVGVDIFFVISGFLITGQLMREARQTGSIHLGRFWARRARRLLPASLTVIGASLAATVLFVPEYFWKQFLSEFIAATLYFQNWRLHWDAVDYLARENIASPVEHFWSLSVEEQFYLVWPLLVILAWHSFRSGSNRSRQLLTAIVFVLITVASLAFCIAETSKNPSGAYFATTTRAWEFGVGSLLACLPSKWSAAPPKLQQPVVLAGLTLLACSVFIFTDDMAFPGFLAMVPVVGTAAVIWARADGPASFTGKLLGARPLQFVGNNSYSAYLWHWPLIVVLPHVLGEPLDWQWLIVVLGLSFALAIITRKLVEDPVRHSNRLRQSHSSWTYAVSAAGMAIVVAMTGVVAASAFATPSGDATNVERAFSSGCLGAGPALEPSRNCDDRTLNHVLLPRSADLDADSGNAFDCWIDQNEDLKSCSYGPENGILRVALVGDSHAAMLIPGLVPQLASVNWTLDTYVGWGCQWTVSVENQCKAARVPIQDRLLNGDYDLVLTTAARHAYAGQPYQQAVEDYAAAWKPVVDSGVRVVAIADNPMPSPTARQCLISAQDDHEKAKQCATDKSTANALPDHLIDAAIVGGIPLLRLDEAYCLGEQCPMIINHVVVYRDESHITATFSRTLGPEILHRLQSILSRG
ncbi:acyltransferase family protein [Pseudarthrobacter oxydans]|uniref:acyltransferase family protein n=1 Tax=Pseudarthrobacter oxydans TaxID=1671 RepID=UPI003ECEA5B4